MSMRAAGSKERNSVTLSNGEGLHRQRLKLSGYHGFASRSSDKPTEGAKRQPGTPKTAPLVRLVSSSRTALACGGIALILLILLSGCTVVKSQTPVKVALLAPFEGRYREVGYNALYAARLAAQDANNAGIELLPIDDGGSAESAADRARALASDPQVKAALVLGYAATDSGAQQAFGDVPAVIVGDWGAQPASQTTFILSNPALDSRLTVPTRVEVTDAAALAAPLTGGDVFALVQFPKLRGSTDGITVLSSGSLPDDTFQQRYAQSDQFAPPPGLLATLTYDATRILWQSVSDTRADTSQRIASTNYSGINRTIRFENGYWADAPLYEYRYRADGTLFKP
jgi:substrate-binding family protein